MDLGLLLVGMWLVVCNSFFLLQAFFPLRVFTYDLFVRYYPPQQLVWMISSAILVGFIIGGYRLLRREEYGRGLITFLAIVDIPHLVVGKAIFNSYRLEPMYFRNMYLISFSVAADIAIIYFLNRPRVREQFQ
ncbi:MAG: hypothetical protein V1727_04440 [Candidatus Omnitrophota bacterium]